MSQHDYDIANGSGSTVRADLNNALAAIVSQNSGATAPTTTFPNMTWFDTTAGILKIRNNANTTWVPLLEATGAYPVGSIYINATNSANPSTLLGFGTWVAFGAGRVPVGFNSSDPLFDSAEETGGSKDAIVVSHTHTTGSAGAATGSAVLGNPGDFGPRSASGIFSVTGALSNRPQGSAGGGSYENLNVSVPDHTHSVSTTGSSGTNANLQPYITVYMWKRTA